MNPHCRILGGKSLLLLSNAFICSDTIPVDQSVLSRPDLGDEEAVCPPTSLPALTFHGPVGKGKGEKSSLVQIQRENKCTLTLSLCKPILSPHFLAEQTRG